MTAPGDLIEFAQGDDRFDVVTGDRGPTRTSRRASLGWTGRYQAFAEDPSKNGK